MSTRCGIRTLVLSGAVTALGACASVQQPAETDAIRSTADPDVIARGRYLVNGPGHCLECHGDPAASSAAPDVPLSGGREFSAGPLGTIAAPNLTNDTETGIDAVSDATLVRSLRYGISRDGRRLAPFMSFSGLSDRDLQAILSYLRTLPPAPGTPPEELGWLKSLAVRLAVDAGDTSNPPPENVTPARTAPYGRYLAYDIANCHGCHTRRGKLTGRFTGTPFAGGMELEEPTGTYVVPSLRPGSESVMSALTEEQFIELFRRKGRSDAETPMPWASYARMSDDDLGALYRFLRTLPPATRRGRTRADSIDQWVKHRT